ncbi:Transposon Tf2-8 polyprotein [Labeo rohita]|uniref:Gypsy retrotransposon integrase-like protein 1 n=1 Tax=Labeo rohita TaxID=84645 RepID=A0ABQ8MX59_LABRO|nr:Transposon Tf2-8 polyprotein [Labeo rohita]
MRSTPSFSRAAAGAAVSRLADSPHDNDHLLAGLELRGNAGGWHPPCSTTATSTYYVTAHPFTVTRVLIAYTWFHSAPPYLRPWQSVPHRLVYRSQPEASSRPLFVLLPGFPVFQPGLCADVFSKQAATQLPPHRPHGTVRSSCCLEHNYPKEEFIPCPSWSARRWRSTLQRPYNKKDGGLRPCIDYRQLNSQISHTPFHCYLPHLRNSEELECSPSWTCGVHTTSFVFGRETSGRRHSLHPHRHYEYRVMPYGLSIRPSVFQTYMNEVFREFLHRFVIVYIDDILIYSRDLADHRQHIQPVLLKLREQSLYLKLEKCEFHRPSVQFLGYIISAEGVQMDQGKVHAIQEWPTPTTIKELQWFLGFSNFYRRFIQGYSLITAPLTSLLRVEVDASTSGVGAVLSQAVCDPPLLHPCAYYSRKLTSAEQNYDVGNRELLAIKLALEEWRHWLEGSAHPFNIITDHKNLQYLPDSPAEPEPIIPPDVILSPIIWGLEHNIRHATLQEPAPPGCPEGKIYVPRSQRLHLLGTVHESPGSGHPGSRWILSLLQARYWWPSMHHDVSRYVLSCSVCAMSNTPRHLPTGKLVPLPIPQRPWSHIGVDFVTDLPNSEGNTCILVFVDRFSKSCRLIPLRGLPTALETIEHLFQHIFRNYGLLEEIVSDWGPQFISHVWKAFFKLLGVSVNLSSGYHLQTNGQTKRKTQELGRYLRSYCQEDQYSWSRFLPWAEYAQNSLRQDTTGMTPFQCVLGYQPPLFPWTEEPSNVPAVEHWFRASERVDLVWLSTRDLRLRLPCRKLSPRYIGPFKILRQINNVTFQLQLPPRYRIHPTFHVSLLKPFSPSATDTAGAGAEPPPPEVLDQPSIYLVHEILDSRRRGGRLEYLVDWEGYGLEERSWVARDDVLDPALLLDFHRNHLDRPAPRSRVRVSGAAHWRRG